MIINSIPKTCLLHHILSCDRPLLNNRQPDRDNSSHTCGICLSVPENKIHIVITDCHHIYCEECFYNYLHFTLNNCNNYFPFLTCPQCNKEILNTKLFDLIKNFQNLNSKNELILILTNKLIDSEIQHKFKLNELIITCSSIDCARIFLPKNEKIGHCTECNKDTCLICENKTHGILNCIQNKKLKSLLGSENDYNSAVYIASNTINCPNCLVRLNRNKGCNHLTCVSCKYEFCWVCLDDWKNHNFETGGFYLCLKRANKVLKIKNIKDADASKENKGKDTKEGRDKEIWLDSFTMYHDQMKGIKILKEIENKELQHLTEQLVKIKKWLKDFYFLLFYFSKRKNKFSDIQALIVRLEKVCEEPYEFIENYGQNGRANNGVGYVDKEGTIKKIEKKLSFEIKYMENYIEKFVK